MNNYFNIGSLIIAGGYKLLVIGHYQRENEYGTEILYGCVQYPIGFTGTDTVYMVPRKDITKCLADGFSDENTEKYYEKLETYFDTVEKM